MLPNEALIVAHPALPCLLGVLEELVGEELLDGPALLRVLNEALLDKVGELGAPLVRNALDRVVDHRVEQILQIFRPIVERRVTLRQLERKAPESPNVDLGGVGVPGGDLGRDPARGALLGLAILLLLGEEDAEAHVGDLHIAVPPAENVVRFYIAVQDIARMHGLKAKSDLV